MRIGRLVVRALTITAALGGIFLFGFLVYVSGPAQVVRQMASVGVAGALAVLGSVILSMAFWSLSWFALLYGAGLTTSWPSLFAPLLAGYAVTYITPSAYLGGEPVRAYWVARLRRVPMAQVMGTVVVERILAGVAVLLFVCLGGFVALTQPGVSRGDRYAVALGLAVMAAFLGLGVAAVIRQAHWLSAFLRWLGRGMRFRGWLARAAARVAETETEVHRAFSQYLPMTALSFLLQLLGVFVSYMRPQLFFFFTGRDLFTFAQLSLYFTLSTFINAFLWVSPGGFGLTDGGRVGVFTLLGISPSGAMAFNLVFRFAEMLVAGVGLFLLVRQGLLRFRRGKVEVRVEEHPPRG